MRNFSDLKTADDILREQAIERPNLSRREYFAGLFAQALVYRCGSIQFPLIRDAVNLADCPCEELDKEDLPASGAV